MTYETHSVPLFSYYIKRAINSWHCLCFGFLMAFSELLVTLNLTIETLCGNSISSHVISNTFDVNGNIPSIQPRWQLLVTSCGMFVTISSVFFIDSFWNEASNSQLADGTNRSFSVNSEVQNKELAVDF